MKRTFIIQIAVLTLIIGTESIAMGQAYREAREKLRENAPPAFLSEQIEEVKTAPASETIQPGTEWLKAFTVWAKEARDEHSLEETLRVVHPLLLEPDSRRIQEAARIGEVEALLAQRPSLPVLINAVFANNPSIRAASEAWNATLNRYEQSMYLEGIQQQYNAFTKRLDLLTSGMSGTAQRIASEFPFPGLTALRGGVARTDIHLAELELAKTLRDVIAETTRLAYELAYLHHAISITSENVSLLEQMLEVTSSKFEAGTASYIFVLQARIEHDRLQTDLAALRDQRQSVRGALNALLDRPTNATLGEPATPARLQAPPMETALRIALENRQEIQIAERMLKRVELMIAMSKKMERPDPTLGASYFEDRSGLLVGAASERPAFNPQPKMMARPWFGERESFIQEMIGRKEAMRARVRESVNETRSMIESAYAELNTAKRESALYRDLLLPDAEQMLTVSESDYRSARINFVDYLEVQRAWLNTNLAHHAAQRDAGIALVELETIMGGAIHP